MICFEREVFLYFSSSPKIPSKNILIIKIISVLEELLAKHLASMYLKVKYEKTS
jgi:hypothetical protein